jgi:Ni,Fe-hydrogenase I small subunit
MAQIQALKPLQRRWFDSFYDNSLMTAEGNFAMEKLNSAMEEDFILAVEGRFRSKTTVYTTSSADMGAGP